MTHAMRRRALILGGLFLSLGAASGAGAAEPPPGPPKPVFVALGDFTINLHGKSEQFGFVVVSVTVQVVPEAANGLRDIMPRIKEGVMRRLMVLADRGALLPGQTDPLILKEVLAETLNKLKPDAVQEVLITRLMYG